MAERKLVQGLISQNRPNRAVHSRRKKDGGRKKMKPGVSVLPMRSTFVAWSFLRYPAQSSSCNTLQVNYALTDLAIRAGEQELR